MPDSIDHIVDNILQIEPHSISPKSKENVVCAVKKLKEKSWTKQKVRLEILKQQKT